MKIMGKTVFFNLTRDKNDENSMANFVDNKYKISLDITRASFYVKVGVENNAMYSALAYSLVQRLIFIVTNYFCQTQRVEVEYKGDIVNETEVDIYTTTRVNASLGLVLAEIIGFTVGKIKADLKNKKIKKENEIKYDIGTKGQTVRTVDGKLV